LDAPLNGDIVTADKRTFIIDGPAGRYALKRIGECWDIAIGRSESFGGNYLDTIIHPYIIQPIDYKF
jgi:hypothetical protein